MKQLVTAYTFSNSAKTITSPSFTTLDAIQLITNVTTNQIVYNFADPTKGGSLSGTTLTLAAATVGTADSNRLQIFIDVPESGLTDAQLRAGEVAVSVTGLPLPAGAATSAKQLPDNHNVTVSNFPATQAVTDTDAETGLTQRTTRFRDRLVAQRYTVISDSIANGLSSIWTQTTQNGGTIGVTGGEGLLQTSTATDGLSQLTSTVMRYHPGQVSWLNSAVRFGAATAGNRQRMGAYVISGTTAQDGFFFEQNGTTFDAVVIKGGTEVSRTPSTSWSRVAQAPFTFDTNFHQYEFGYTTNGVDFLIDNVVHHRVVGTNAPITNTLDFSMSLQNFNTTNTTNVTMGVRNIGMGRFGTPPSEYTSGSIIADQVGANAVQTFTFPVPVDFVWVSDIGTTTTNISRVDPFGGTPTANAGIPVFNGAPTPVNVVPASSTIRVYAPTGSTINVYGLRYVG